MTSNVGKIDRMVRIIVGLLLIAAPFVTQIGMFQSTMGTAIAVIVGVVLIATSAMRFCPLYRIFGIKTCKV
jgi:hypothetical protein